MEPSCIFSGVNAGTAFASVGLVAPFFPFDFTLRFPFPLLCSNKCGAALSNNVASGHMWPLSIGNVTSPN